MGTVISFFLRLGIVRVLSVPVAMILIIWILWVLAAPPSDLDDQGTTQG